MSPLRLELLGPPRLVSPDGEVVSTSPLPMALLAFLALGERPISREHLAELFWPGLDRSRRLHNLRQTILRLKSSHTQDIVVGDGMLHIRPMTLETDVEAFKRDVVEGRIADGVALWRGAFLEGFRRPQSWELEDWIDRQRALLEVALVDGVIKGARDALDANAPAAALDLLRTPRNILPEDENLGVLEVMALAGQGRRAEAEGLLKTLDVPEGSELESEALEALGACPDLSTVAPQPVPEQKGDADLPVPALPEPVSASGSGLWGRRVLLWLSAAFLLLTLSVVALRWRSAGAAISGSDAAGYRLLLCTSWESPEGPLQLFRMKFDGTEKHRLSSEYLCEGAWIEEAQAVFGSVPHPDPEARLVRLDPDPSNPIAEWTLSEVESARDLRAPRIMRTNPKVGPGGVLVFSAEDSEGNRDIYTLDPIQDEVRRLTDSPERDDWPTVAPQGDRVVFTSFRTGAGDLYSVGLDGRGLRRITDNALQDGAAWVRGDSAIFVRGRGTEAEDGNMELFLLNLSTGEETRLTDNAWNDYEQMWSADGRYLCWQSEELGHFESDIMMMDLATNRSWNATGTPGRESDCRLTPVGNGLLYLRHGDPEGTEVFFQDRRGGDPVNLSRYPGSESIVGYFVLPKDMY